MIHLTILEPIFSAEFVIIYQSGYSRENLPKAIKQAILEYILFSFNHEKHLPESILNLCKTFKVLKI